jgi:hypothetical protein
MTTSGTVPHLRGEFFEERAEIGPRGSIRGLGLGERGRDFVDVPSPFFGGRNFVSSFAHRASATRSRASETSFASEAATSFA